MAPLLSRKKSPLFFIPRNALENLSLLFLSISPHMIPETFLFMSFSRSDGFTLVEPGASYGRKCCNTRGHGSSCSASIGMETPSCDHGGFCRLYSANPRQPWLPIILNIDIFIMHVLYYSVESYIPYHPHPSHAPSPTKSPWNLARCPTRFVVKHFLVACIHTYVRTNIHTWMHAYKHTQTTYVYTHTNTICMCIHIDHQLTRPMCIHIHVQIPSACHTYS